MDKWWAEEGKRSALQDQARRHGTPLYVYDMESVQERLRRLRRALVDDGGPVQRLLFALKANPHAAIAHALAAAGVGLECVSPSEVDYARAVLAAHGRSSTWAGVEAGRPSAGVLLFTPNFAPRAEYAAAARDGTLLTLDSLYALERWPAELRGAAVALRVDPEFRAGHHEHVKTAGRVSKFGISVEDLPAAKKLADAAGARVVGLHAHAGSGIRDAALWANVAAVLARMLDVFPDVRFLDLGGGLAVVERDDDPDCKPVDLAALRAGLVELRAAAKIPASVELWMEPGRFFVAEAGALLTRVTQLKGKGDYTYVGVDCGFNSLVRPILYSSYHHIVNLDRLDAPADMHADVVGMICESGDVLGRDRRLPKATDEGDLMLIATVGAYGHSMSSAYNMREPAKEVVLFAEQQ